MKGKGPAPLALDEEEEGGGATAAYTAGVGSMDKSEWSDFYPVTSEWTEPKDNWGTYFLACEKKLVVGTAKVDSESLEQEVQLIINCKTGT